VPLVSVCMKSYNHDKFTAEAIESVFGQDFADLELIIVDDGSTDAADYRTLCKVGSPSSRNISRQYFGHFENQ
jgi:GT2 family glycosyltransferase